MNQLRRRLTLDWAKKPTVKPGPFYTIEQISPKQSLTPEGFLLCEDVPLARAGEMIYGPGEVPIESVHGQPVVVHREIDELFKVETIASFNGKVITNEHPDEDVNPKNIKKFFCGTLLNVRKGEGDNEGLLVGDLLVMDPEAIEDVRSDKREVSLGYDADYEEVSPGVGRQTNIIGNHVALVERGRCGPRCAIGDQATVPRKDETEMATATVKGLPARRRLKVSDALAKFKDAATEALKDLEDGEGTTADEEGGGGGGGMPNIHIHMNGSTAPAGATSTVDETGYPEDTSQNPDGSQATGGHKFTEDDPVEARFQALEQSVNGIYTLLKQMGGQSTDGNGDPGGQPGPAMGHGEPDGDEPGSRFQAPGNSPMANDELPDDVAEGMAEETNDNRMTKDHAKKFRDSAPLEGSYRETISECEILVPGFRMPTYDRAAKPVNTYKQICLARTKALDAAYMTTQGKQIIDSVTGGRTFDTSVMSCSKARNVFKAAVGAKRLINNQTGMTRDSALGVHTASVHSLGVAQGGTQIGNVEDLNAVYKKHYGRK